MFLDIADIEVVSGKGGAGCVSTRREKYMPRGGPDGGNGGAGGSVVVEATSASSTLLDFRYRRKYKAANGLQGSGNCRTGAGGEDLVIPVPCGTSVFDREDDRLLGDLVETGDRVHVARGGRGGKGNYEFRNARNQTPMFAQPGEEGEARSIRLELKLIADLGLIGEPNAGKSTLLAAMTAARPKIAGYPFTTLQPNLGIVDLGDYRSCTLADIPGLIEGAAAGKGLGLEFLRHVERTRALLLLVDPSQEDPVVQLDMLRGELADYGRRLPQLEFAVVLTKRDLLDDELADLVLAEVREWAERNGARETIIVSAATRFGLDDLRKLMLRLL